MPGLASLASKLGGKLDTKTRGAYLIRLKPPDDSPDSSVRFQYFPETFSDSKAVNYQTKEVPGGSLPIYQWISSGERSISFTAVFSSDVDLLAGEPPIVTDATTPTAIVERLKNLGAAGRNADIRKAIVWLREYLLPKYVGDKTHAPNKVRLYIPGSGIGAAGGDPDVLVSPDGVTCVMTQCEVSYESFFPSGLPRLVTVSIGLAQTAQANGIVRFPRRSNELRSYGAGYTKDVAFKGLKES